MGIEEIYPILKKHFWQKAMPTLNDFGIAVEASTKEIETLYQSTNAELVKKVEMLEEANRAVRHRIALAESIMKKFGSNVAIGEPSWNAVILPEIEEYQGKYFNGDEITRVDLAKEPGASETNGL